MTYKAVFFAAVLSCSVANVLPASAADGATVTISVPAGDTNSFKAAELYNGAIDLMGKKDWTGARTKLEEAAKFDQTPLSLQIHTNLAVALMHLNLLEPAIESLKIADKYSPNDETVLVDTASCYQQLGDIPRALIYFQAYLKYHPKGSNAKQVQELVVEFKRMKTSSGDANAKDYLSDATGGRICRYKTPRGPLKIFIASGDNVTGYKKEYDGFLSAAFDAWLSASQVLTWERVQDKSAAEIVCLWSDGSSGLDGNTRVEAGNFQNSLVNNAIVASKISLFTVPMPGVTLGDDTMRHACLHEVGHALGLIEHSHQNTDIMFYSETATPLSALSDRDKATMARLYQTEITKPEKKETK